MAPTVPDAADTAPQPDPAPLPDAAAPALVPAAPAVPGPDGDGAAVAGGDTDDPDDTDDGLRDGPVGRCPDAADAAGDDPCDALLLDPLLWDEPVDLAAVRADDALIDALGGGDPSAAAGLVDDDDPLIAMLAAWAASTRPQVPAPDTERPTLAVVGEAPAATDDAPNPDEADGDATPAPAVPLFAVPAEPAADHRPAEPRDPAAVEQAPEPATVPALVPLRAVRSVDLDAATVPALVADATTARPGGDDAPVRRRPAARRLGSVRPWWRRADVDGRPLPAIHPLRRAAVAVVVAALGVSGAAAAGGTAQPGDLGFPMTRVFFGERARSLEAAQVVSTGLHRARQYLEGHRPDLAAQELQRVDVALPDVRDQEGRRQLAEQQHVLETAVALAPPFVPDPAAASDPTDGAATPTPARTEPDRSILAGAAPESTGADGAAGNGGTDSSDDSTDDSTAGADGRSSGGGSGDSDGTGTDDAEKADGSSAARTKADGRTKSTTGSDGAGAGASTANGSTGDGSGGAVILAEPAPGSADRAAAPGPGAAAADGAPAQNGAAADNGPASTVAGTTDVGVASATPESGDGGSATTSTTPPGTTTRDSSTTTSTGTATSSSSSTSTSSRTSKPASSSSAGKADRDRTRSDSGSGSVTAVPARAGAASYTVRPAVHQSAPKQAAKPAPPTAGTDRAPSTRTHVHGSDPTGSHATGSHATGSHATGSDATGSDATGTAAPPAAEADRVVVTTVPPPTPDDRPARHGGGHDDQQV